MVAVHQWVFTPAVLKVRRKAQDNNDLNQVSEPGGFRQNLGLVKGGGSAYSRELTNLVLTNLVQVLVI